MRKAYLAFIAIISSLAVNAQSTLLHYDTPAKFFEEALPIGNGSQGAMVYGGIDEDKISLNDITLWMGEPDVNVYSPQAYKTLSAVREALFKENYRLADSLQHDIQGHNASCYQPLGTLFIRNITPQGDNAKAGYQRCLDIEKAMVNVNLANEKREYFASAPDSVIVIRLKADDGSKFSKILSYSCQLMNHIIVENNEITITGYAAYGNKPDGQGRDCFAYDSSRGIHFRTIVHLTNKDGKVRTSDDGELILTDCTDATIIIANVTSFNGNDKDPVKEGRDFISLVRKRMDNALSTSYDQIAKRHQEDYASLYNRMNIDLGTTDDDIKQKTTEKQLLDYTDKNERNPDLEELYFNYGRYLLISCSRTENVPANLQGLWNEYLTPPWSCDYTTNINLQENYWPAETANLSELHMPMLSFLDRLPFTGTKTAKAYYDVDRGWCLAHNTDIWGMTCPVGHHNDSPSWANWNLGSAWVCTHIWEHFAFTQDNDYLRKAYPTMKGAADFYLKWLIPMPGKSKYLITAPSTSPENIYKTPDGYEGCTVYGGFADMAMLREFLTDTRNATLALGEDKAYADTLDRTIARLLPYRIGKKGNLQEWFHDWEDKDPQHRHQSHLFGLYPGHHITMEGTPELAKACKRTLEIKGDRTTGWSTGWRVNLQARLHEAENAYHIYRVLLAYVSPDRYEGQDKRYGGGTYPNLFDAHSPFQIDGNFGGTAGVIEMLVQSNYNFNSKNPDKSSVEIDLLPALPKAWQKAGSAKGICIRGGYSIDFEWKNGTITSVTVHEGKEIKQGLAKRINLTIKQGKKQLKDYRIL